MGDKTEIEWTDATWNPIVGCTRCSPGCDHCYAISVVHRGMSPQHVGLTMRPDDDGPIDWTGEIRPVPHLFDQPSRWKRPRRIFVNSLSDLFHPDLSPDVGATIIAEMARNPRHTFQVLTKRPQRMAEIVGMIDPLPNVWWGASIESDRYSWRANHLRKLADQGHTVWISAEPLLGGLPSLDLAGISWVVAGGESGPGARPMHPDWARDLRDRCTLSILPGGALNIGVRPAFLFKQWGDWAPRVDLRPVDILRADPENERVVNRPGMAQYTVVEPEWATGMWSDRNAVMAHVGKKVAGRELDGRTWDEYPA